MLAVLVIFAVGIVTLMLFTSQGRRLIGGIIGIFLVGCIVIGLGFGALILLDNLNNDDDQISENRNIQKNTKTREEVLNEDIKLTEKIPSEPLTLYEIDEFRKQINSCINLPAGYSGKKVKVVIFIEVNPDRTIKSAKVVDQERMKDSDFKLLAGAAMRGLNDQDCIVLNLPKNKYEYWKEINLTINSNDFF